MERGWGVSKSTEPHKPAFPANIHDAGLTKREYFAAMAMQGILARTGEGWCCEGAPAFAIDCADELIRQLNSTKQRQSNDLARPRNP